MNTWTCNLCEELLHADELSDHFRLLHPNIDAAWETTPVVHQENFLHDIYKSYVWTLIRSREWIGVADWAVHALHLPKEIRYPVCDAWDKYLGVTEDEMHRKKLGVYAG